MAKLILVSDHWDCIKTVQEFAQKRGYEFSYYKEKDWKDVYLNENVPVALHTEVLPAGSRPVLSMEEMESHTIKKIIFECGGNIQKAAQILKISRSTLYRKINSLNISKKDSCYRKQESDSSVVAFDSIERKETSLRRKLSRPKNSSKKAA